MSSYVPSVFPSILTNTLEDDIFNNNTQTHRNSPFSSLTDIDTKKTSIQSNGIMLNPNIGCWIYEISLEFQVRTHMFLFHFLKNDMFPGHAMIVGIGWTKNNPSQHIIGHGDYRLEEDMEMVYISMNAIIAFTDANTYYMMELQLPVLKDDRKDFTMKNSLVNLLPSPPPKIKLSYLNKRNHDMDDFDTLMRTSILDPYETLRDMIPTPVSLKVERGETPPMMEIDITIKRKDFVEWTDYEDMICIIHFIGTPLFMTHSTDNVITMLDPQNGSYHKFHPYTFLLSREDMRIWAQKNDNTCLHMKKVIPNKFINIPTSIVFTIQKRGEKDTDYFTFIDKCKYIHQHFVDTPSYLPRYLFLDQMPKIRLEIFQITICEYIIKIYKDRTLSIPFTSNIWFKDNVSGEYWYSSFNETTSLLVFRIPYSSIQPQLKRKRISIEYNVVFDKCRQNVKDHFVLLPIDDLVGGRAEILVDVDKFLPTRSGSYEKHLFVLCDTCHKEKKNRKDRCNDCFRYKSALCACCGNRIYLSTLNPSLLFIDEVIEDEEGEEKSRFLFRHKKCPDLKIMDNIPGPLHHHAKVVHHVWDEYENKNAIARFKVKC